MQRQRPLARVFALLFLSALVQCQSRPPQPESAAPPKPHVIASVEIRSKRDTAQAVGETYAISTQGAYATQAAQEMYKLGGNIVDAAIAASFVISVERPHSTGIGGGGFMLFHQAKTKKVYAVDFRERAPLKAHENMFIEASGEVNKMASRNGVLAVATPGLIAGLVEIHRKFGKLPWATLIEPSIRLAEKGFRVYPTLARALFARAPTLMQDPAARAIFMRSPQEPLKEGELLVQKDLAQTLRLIAKTRGHSFYEGATARKITRFMKKSGGLLTANDLKRYRVKWREPLKGDYKGYQIVSMPPPSSGGVHVIQFLNMLEHDKLAQNGFLSTSSIHLAAAALQSVFVDRARHLGDPDFVSVPVTGLTDKSYAQLRRKEILDRARKADEMGPGKPLGYESMETTHLSFMDAEGNAVSTTQTINGWMGAAVVVPGTGILLNNEMDDFAAKVGEQNLFGAVGGKPDSIAPLKTPLSSMAPTLVFRDGKLWMTLGAPGGTRIISCVAQTILNVVEFGLPLYEAVASIRYHHQWQPDTLIVDPPGPENKVLQRLKQMGYHVVLQPVGCYVMAIQRDGNTLRAVADPRDISTAHAQ